MSNQLQSDLARAKAILARDVIKFNVENLCFDKQLEFIQDPAPFKTACCSRRAGKTIADAAYLVKGALSRSGVICLYITLTRANGKRLIWPELLEINRRFKLGGHFNETELSIKFPNKSIIYISGAKDESEIEKFRGLPLFLCIIDEMQSFRAYIEKLIDEVISKALFDYGGTLALTGTPGPVPSGYFYDVCHSPQYKQFAWTFFDNPWIEKKSGQTPQALLDRELQRKGCGLDDPTIQRECFGKWVIDQNALVIKYSAETNHYESAQDADDSWHYIFGVDLGFDDADAIAVIGWNSGSNKAYLVEERITRKQGITDLARQIEELIVVYSPDKIVMDTGGLGKKIAEEITKRFQLPVVAAEKARKFEFIELLNDALRTRQFMAKKKSQFAQDAALLEWDRDSATLKIRDTFHSDICVARGSLITTQRGEIKIEDLKRGDFALTRIGFRRILAWAQTSPNSELLELRFNNFEVLRCTPSHPIFTLESGFVRADKLTLNHTMISIDKCIQEQSYLMELRSEGIQTRSPKPTNFTTLDIGAKRRSTFIGLYGQRLMGQFLKAIISTIKMGIDSITLWKIWNVLVLPIINKLIGLKIGIRDLLHPEKTCVKPLRLLKNGTPALLDRHGIRTMQFHGEKKTEKQSVRNAPYVRRVIGQTQSRKEQSFIALERVEQKHEEIPVRMISNTFVSYAVSPSWQLNSGHKCTVVGLVQLPKPIENGSVYNITVDEKHEYFANGILNSNCDAVLYGFREALHWLYEQPIEVPVKNSPKWYQKEVEDMEERARVVMDRFAEDPLKIEEW